ncbi:hypothetical protein [Mesorhizobium sp. M7A.F.Ca.MR.362.00.0.0]|uniref:hypothetical protein n=1 Tax=Mesorhizobium sp. M7A.F.Ca.MR.362.00.0.0 TaxID=2496779 RepID=UPI001FE1507E|nr:hypothetical protein [Mesorhizobium sp. M7A.F.Ca.MR.362.00.0.0]
MIPKFLGASILCGPGADDAHFSGDDSDEAKKVGASFHHRHPGTGKTMVFVGKGLFAKKALQRAVVFASQNKPGDVTPKWAFLPTSGAGAAIDGGRFNRPGVEALYLTPFDPDGS